MGKPRKSKNYKRQIGNLPDRGPKKRVINFNLSKIVPDQGQSLKDWEDEGLLLQFNERMKVVGGLTREEALHQKIIKEYSSKTGFPENSKFTKPSYLSPDRWAVMHLTNNSKEVVVGYIENDIFYVVFLDQEHNFWPTDIQQKGKKKNRNS